MQRRGGIVQVPEGMVQAVGNDREGDDQLGPVGEDEQGDLVHHLELVRVQASIAAMSLAFLARASSSWESSVIAGKLAA